LREVGQAEQVRGGDDHVDRGRHGPTLTAAAARQQHHHSHLISPASSPAAAAGVRYVTKRQRQVAIQRQTGNCSYGGADQPESPPPYISINRIRQAAP